MDFETLKIRYNWRPIFGCPGRYVLKNIDPHLSIAALTGVNLSVRIFHTVKAPDPVLVVKIAGGGIISYRKKDGTYVHTLNTEEGFKRKLTMLAIDINA